MNYDPINRLQFYKWLLAFEVIGGTMFVIGIVYLVSYWYYCLKVRRLERHNNFYFGE